MKRFLIGAFALTITLGLAGSAGAALLCQKTTGSGKIKYKVRDACKSSETPVGTLATDVPRTRIFGFDGDGNYVYTSPTPTPVPIHGTNTSVLVNTTAPSTDMMITFHAECAQNGGTGWIYVDVLVDGIPRGSTAVDSSDAFCAEQRYAANSVTVVAPNLPAGGHTISVVATDDFGSGWIDDAGLTVITVED